MDPPSGAPPSLDPCLSLEPISQSDNAELLGSDPPVLSSHVAMSSCDLSHSCTTAAPIQSVQELPAANQLPDASSAPAAPETKLSAEKAQRNTTSSPSKKSHHSSAADARASMQNKSVQSNRSSSQNRAVQWVRVSPPTQAAQKSGNPGMQETGDWGKLGSNECAGMASLSTEMRLRQAVEEIKVSDECVVGSSIEVLEGQTVGPLSSSKTLHHPSVLPPLLCENAPQEAVEDLKILDVNHQAAEDPEILGFGHQAAEDHEISSFVAHQAEEQSVPLPMSAVVVEDEQTSEPQQRSLSRTSSLSAKAREFVPKSVSAPSAPPAMPPQMHSSVMPPLMIPLNSAQGILSMFPPSSPLPSPQLGGFPLPMVGPPPPPIPASLMGPMPILGPPHPGLLNVQLPGPPPPPVIPPPAYMIHSPSSNVPPHLPPAPLMDPLANQAVNPNAEVVQDQHQSQDSDPASAQPGGTKPVLTEELKAKIVKQVEFYFSDVNLPTDYHLMKFVKKDPEGFVPIATVASFRKVRNLMKNYALVATALRSSKQLVVSQDGKKVRRLHPLPHVDLEEIQSRTVVAENLPADHSVESIEQLFGSVGNVKMVRICEPEASNGTNQTAKFTKADMVVSNKLHALVEFETVEQAERSVSELTDQRNWRSGLHVRLLLRRTNNKHSASKSHKMNEGADGSTAEDDAAPSSSDNATERVGEEGHSQERSDELPGSDNSHFDASLKKGRGRGRGGRGRGRGQFHPNGGRSHPVGTPPQANSLPIIEAKPPLGPRMPDGTRGFTLGRGKLVTTNSV